MSSLMQFMSFLDINKNHLLTSQGYFVLLRQPSFNIPEIVFVTGIEVSMKHCQRAEETTSRKSPYRLPKSGPSSAG